MKPFYLSILLVIAISFSSCNGTSQKKADKQSDTDIPSLTLLEFNEQAGNLVGQKIEIIGIVDHVCKHGGKKLSMVAEGAHAHVYATERFNEDLSGQKLKVVGIVEEDRVDENQCDHMEKEIKEHLEKGDIDEIGYDKSKERIDYLRDSMKKINANHISFFSLRYVSHEVVNE